MGRLTHHTGPGWTYFTTTKAFQSAFVFQAEETARIVLAKLFEYRDTGNYLLHDFVLMPNHLHAILTPAASVSLEKAMQLIKGGSSYAIHKVRGNKIPVWQSGFHESRVTSWADYQKKADYIRFNPIAAKLVEQPKDWPYSSACPKFQLDPIPQGLKPFNVRSANVGPKGPTPSGLTNVSATLEANAPTAPAQTPRLKSRPPEEQVLVGAKAPTAGNPSTNDASFKAAKA